MAPATPKPESRLLPTEEEFAAWCEHPVTRFVAASHVAQADICQVLWSEKSWNGGVADEKLLTELRARADTYRAFVEAAWLDHFRAVQPQAWKEYVDEQRRIEFGESPAGPRIRERATPAPAYAGPARRHRRRSPGASPITY